MSLRCTCKSSTAQDATHDFESEREFFEERAAIIEFDAGLDRAHAERAAREETLARFFDGDALSIVKKAAADGVDIVIENAILRLCGPQDACERWRSTVERFRNDLCAAWWVEATSGAAKAL